MQIGLNRTNIIFLILSSFHFNYLHRFFFSCIHHCRLSSLIMKSSIFSRKKPSDEPLNVKDFYADWYKTLTRDYLPLLTFATSAASTAPASEISDLVNHVLSHVVSYYETLELSADHSTISQLLSTSWLNSQETPFLFLGDIHPNLFTNLLRSLINPAIQESGHVAVEIDRRSEFVNAWQEANDQLETKLSRIELRTTMNVPALLECIRVVERSYVARVSKTWIVSQGKGKKTLTEVKMLDDEIEALLQIYMETYRLKKSIIISISQTLSLYQSTLYLQALCQAFVGLHEEVSKF